MITQSPLYTERRRRRGRSLRVLLSLAAIVLVPPAVPHLLDARIPGLAPRPADAIFVLTGGEGRIQEGYRAWRTGAARELYILGAGRNVPVSIILPAAGSLPPGDFSRIHVEGWSENTLENAFSAKFAVGEGKFSSAILVTSDYHVPRAYLAFRRVLPREVALHVIRVRGEAGAGASWRWARRRFIEGWKYWSYRLLLRWE